MANTWVTTTILEKWGSLTFLHEFHLLMYGTRILLQARLILASLGKAVKKSKIIAYTDRYCSLDHCTVLKEWLKWAVPLRVYSFELPSVGNTAYFDQGSWIEVILTLESCRSFLKIWISYYCRTIGIPWRERDGSYCQDLVVTNTGSHRKLNHGGCSVDSAALAALSELLH